MCACIKQVGRINQGKFEVLHVLGGVNTYMRKYTRGKTTRKLFNTFEYNKQTKLSSGDP